MCLHTVFIIPFERISRFYFEFYEHGFELIPRLTNQKFCICHKFYYNYDLALFQHHYWPIKCSFNVKVNRMIYHLGVGECQKPMELTPFVCVGSNFEMFQYLLLRGFSIGFYLANTVFCAQSCFYHLFHCKMCYKKYMRSFFIFLSKFEIFYFEKHDVFFKKSLKAKVCNVLFSFTSEHSPLLQDSTKFYNCVKESNQYSGYLFFSCTNEMKTLRTCESH